MLLGTKIGPVILVVVLRVPKLRLGTRILEALLKGHKSSNGNNVGASKRSFREVRFQTEFGNES